MKDVAERTRSSSSAGVRSAAHGVTIPARCPTSTRCSRQRGRCSARLRALPRGRSPRDLARCRRLDTAFMAEGLPARGEAAPATTSRAGYNLWLVGHQVENGRAPWRDPYSFQPQVEPRWNLAGWPFGWSMAAAARARHGPRPGTSSSCSGSSARAGSPPSGCGRWGCDAVLRSPAGSRFALAPYLQTQWSAGHLLAWTAMLLPLSLYGVERAQAGLLVVARALRRGARLDPALGPAPPLAGGDRRSSAATRSSGCAGPLLGLPAIAAGLVAYVLAVRGHNRRQRTPVRAGRVLSAHASDFFSRNTDDLEKVVYLGWTVVALALAGLVSLVLWRRYGMAAVLGLGALVPILFALGSNLPGYHAVWRHPPRPAPHAGAGAADARRLPRSRRARRDGGLAPALAGHRGDRGLGAPRRAPARPVPRDRLPDEDNRPTPSCATSRPAACWSSRLHGREPGRERLPLLPDAGAARASMPATRRRRRSGPTAFFAGSGALRARTWTRSACATSSSTSDNATRAAAPSCARDGPITGPTGCADVGSRHGGLAHTDTGQGRPVVLLHGLTCHLGYWLRVTPSLDRVRVIALDFRGHGLSDHADSYGYADYVSDLFSLLDRLELDR